MGAGRERMSSCLFHGFASRLWFMAIRNRPVPALALLAAVQALAQPPANIEPRIAARESGRPLMAGRAAEPVIRAYSDLVLVPAVVTDRHGALVSGLPL